ncbi:hypothetical protein [Rhodanobacter sp. L36]|uniref:hypothetical protein n=1 Tax=Rhodanobacter sp. L36 TaxID=1747221 RepID=UPI00131E2D76|nr:hypothetical protein [Rhodanobacter sp. L36]
MLKWLLLIFCFWTFQAMAAGNNVSTPPPAYAGTYAVLFCQGSCGSATYRNGTLVLFDRPLLDEHGHTRSKWLEQGLINGCLALDPLHGPPSAWVFSQEEKPRRFIVWSAVEDHSISFDLDHDVDAGYQVKLRLTPFSSNGTGMFWGDFALMSKSQPPRQDAIEVRRIGDADPARCPHLDIDADAMDNVFKP